MQSARAATVLALAAFLAAACGGDGPDQPAAGLAPPRFLLASQSGLVLMNLQDERRPLLTFDDGSYPLDPAISPDGTRLAYVRQPPAKQLPDGSIDFGSDLYVADRDGGGSRQVAKHARVAEFLRTPAWLSDTELLFTVRGPDASGFADFRIERMDVVSGRRERYLNFAVDPAVSPDRASVAFVAIDLQTRDETLTVANADLSGRLPLVGPERRLSLFTALAFSPDGGRLAFAAVDLTSPEIAPGGALPGGGVFAAHPFAQDVWIVNVDGSGLRRLAEIAENQPSLTWSEDGAHIYALGPISMWRIDADSGNAEAIGPGVPLGQIVTDRSR